MSARASKTRSGKNLRKALGHRVAGQFVVVVENGGLRSRLLSPREAARLMGLPDEYKLPANVKEALGLMGDGAAVPVVRFLAENLLEPLLAIFDLLRREAPRLTE